MREVAFLHWGEINQVILNSLMNASNAICVVVEDTGSPGKLAVRTRYSPRMKSRPSK